MNCANCKHWFPVEMRCKRFPPVINPVAALKGKVEWEFPKVAGTEVCGEFDKE